MSGNDLIEYRYLNMDNGCRKSPERLHEYARSFRGGTHRAVMTDDMIKGPVLMAYGTRQYTSDAVIALDKRLPHNGGGPS